MSQEMEALRGKHHEVLDTLEQVRKHEAELLRAIEDAKATHAEEVQRLRLEHEEALKAKAAEVDAHTPEILNRPHDESGGLGLE